MDRPRYEATGMTMAMETARLTLREIELDDAPFIHELMNEPPWIQFIGDRGIRTPADARTFITDRLRPSYARDGFGFWLTSLSSDRTPLGICGLIQRPALEYVDIGFALCERYWGQGYAREASEAVIDFARERSGLKTLAALVNPDNARSAKLLESLDFRFERMVRLPDEDEDIHLFLRAL
jgi:RimJ/RimL family protein N-acetyltransferase